jgi:hypothetical protein
MANFGVIIAARAAAGAVSAKPSLVGTYRLISMREPSPRPVKSTNAAVLRSVTSPMAQMAG